MSAFAGPSPSEPRAPSVLLVHASAELYGSDRACLTMASGAVAAGLDTHVLVPVGGPLVARLREAGATVHILDTFVLRRAELRGRGALPVVTGWPRAVRDLHRFSARRRFDLVHSNCAPTVGGALLARWWGVPHVWHVHEIFGDNGPTRFVFERLLAHADVVIAVSGAVAAQFCSPAVTARTRIVYTGGDVPDGIEGVTPLARSPVELICVGRLNRWKGQEFLIQAAALLRSRGLDVRLTLVGDVFGSEHHFREQLADLAAGLELGPFVSFLGERRDAAQLMANADIVVVPSAQPEPFGIVVVEAMALGRPIVASDAGGPREMITSGHDGLLVRPRDPGAMADAIARLIDDPTRARQLGAQAKLTARRFSTAAMAERVIETYRELLRFDG